MIKPDSLTKIAESVGRALLAKALKLTAAESCTGGWVCQAVTAISGSSDWFDRGFITYSNEAKQELLDVPESLLKEFGAVSEETVRAMTAGALAHSRADIAIAISGIAGPTGATPGKPVGTVWLAWQRRGKDSIAKLEQFTGDRTAIRAQAVAAALHGLLDLLEAS